jgi:acyl-CoA synthetase (NDP forming)
MNAIIKKAMDKGQKALSEFDSKRVIKSAGVPITKEALATTKKEAIAIAKKIGYPVVFKGCSDTLTHKTEMGMVKVGISSDKEAGKAYDELVKKKLKIDGILVQEMIKGNREFVIGLTRDPQFGPCVMFGLGGIFTEALKDVSFRVAPITEADAEEMIDEIKTKALLEAFRGSPPVDRSILVKSLVGIGKLGFENDEIAEIDINPLIISGKKPVAVDALVILKNPIK